MKIRDETSISAFYKKTGENEYTTYLSASEGKSTLIDLSIPVWNEEAAMVICDNWKKKNSEIYQHLIRELM